MDKLLDQSAMALDRRTAAVGDSACGVSMNAKIIYTWGSTRITCATFIMSSCIYDIIICEF